jgi:hypothetical protein
VILLEITCFTLCIRAHKVGIHEFTIYRQRQSELAKIIASRMNSLARFVLNQKCDGRGEMPVVKGLIIEPTYVIVIPGDFSAIRLIQKSYLYNN